MPVCVDCLHSRRGKILLLMSFFKTIKSAFGFSDAESMERELEGLDARVVPLRKRHGMNDSPDDDADFSKELQSSGGPVARENTSSEVAADSATADHPAQIFETVVRIFNESLPEFLRQSVNEQTQREYLYAALDDSIKKYLEQLSISAQQQCARRWEKERTALQVQLEGFREQNKAGHDDLEEARKLQLSAERQKRALSERVHDLEAQIAQLEGEIEQTSLENKSLINKLRLSSVVGGVASGDSEELAKKILDLQQKNEALEAQAAEGLELLRSAETERDKANDRIPALTAELDGLKVALNAAQEALETEKKNSASVSARLADALETLKLAEEIQAQATDIENELKQKDDELQKLAQAKDAQTESLRQNEMRCEELAEKLQSKDRTIHALEEQADELRKTIENNIFDHAQSESALRSEIERLRESVAAASAPASEESAESEPEWTSQQEAKPKKQKARNRSRKVIDAEDFLEDTNWLIASPAEAGKPMDGTPDPDFGYKEPPRRNEPDNPAQMLLW